MSRISGGASTIGGLSRIGGGAGDEAVQNIINQMKAQLVNTSAELLISKGKIDELERDKKRLQQQIDSASAAVVAAKKEGASAAEQAMAERLALLSAQVSRLTADVRSMEESKYAVQTELAREQEVSAGLRGQIGGLTSAAREAKEEAGARAAELGGRIAALEAEVGGARGREAALAGQRSELQVKVEQYFRSSEAAEAKVAALERELEAAQERARREARESETSAGDTASRVAALQKRVAELSEAGAAAEAAAAAARARAEALQQAKAKAEAKCASLESASMSHGEEMGRLLARSEADNRQLGELETEAMALRSQLADAQSQVSIERAKNSSMEALVAAHGPGSPMGRNLAAALEAEAAQSAQLRSALRGLQAEKDAVADVLSTLGPLPDHVRRRVVDSEAALLSSGTSRGAAARNALDAFTYDGSSGAGGEEEGGGGGGGGGGASPLRGEGSVSGFSVTPSVYGALEKSSLLGAIRRLAAERPRVTEYLNYMDLELRKARMERDKVAGQLENAKALGEQLEGSQSSLKKQLASTRGELSDVSGERNSERERAARAEAELRTRAAELAGTREALETERGRCSSVIADLDEARHQTHLERTALDACRQELERQMVARTSEERRIREEARASLSAAAAAKADAEAAHDKSMKALMTRVSSLESELIGCRQDLANTSSRLSSASMELERSRGEAAGARQELSARELALSESDKARARGEGRARECEGTILRLRGELEGALGERDARAHELFAVRSALSSMQARVSELEALEAMHREDEARLALLNERLGACEAELQVSRAETDAAQLRIGTIAQQAKVDLECAHDATSKVTAELARLHRRYAAEAEEINVLTATNNGKLGALSVENDALMAECAQLRERCRALQVQTAALVNELQEARDLQRQYREVSVRAEAEKQTVQESSAALHRSCLEQLETIKTQYYTFLSMFHPSDGAAAADASAAAYAGGARSPLAATASASSSLGQHLQSSLNEDISSLKRRLERLSEGSLRPFAPEGFSSLSRGGSGSAAAASSSAYMGTPRSSS